MVASKRDRQAEQPVSLPWARVFSSSFFFSSAQLGIKNLPTVKAGLQVPSVLDLNYEELRRYTNINYLTFNQPLLNSLTFSTNSYQLWKFSEDLDFET